MASINETLLKLKKSDFRARFHLTEKDKVYIAEKGMDTVRKHAEEFVRTRLAPAYPPKTESRLRCEAIPYSWHSTLVLAAAVDASKNGIGFRKAKN